MKKFLEYLRTATFRKNLIAALVVIAAVIAIVFFSLRFYTRHNQTIPTPDLKGLHIDEAVQKIKSSSLDYQLDSVYQVDAVPGMVIEQEPLAGTQVKKDRTIYVTIITRTAPDVAFPDLMLKTLIEARALLNSYGLKLGDTTYKADIARDVVLEVLFAGQPINVGRSIPKGSTIDLVLGNGQGANEVEVPDLTGLTLNEVRFALRGSSLTLGRVHYEGIITDSTSAQVIRQQPEPNLERISIGVPIDIYLSNDQRPIYNDEIE